MAKLKRVKPAEWHCDFCRKVGERDLALIANYANDSVAICAECVIRAATVLMKRGLR